VVSEGGKGALYRETLQATGCYVGRVVIATAEFASIPPFLLPSYPGGFIPTAIGMRFPGMTESIGPMWSKTKPTNQTLGTGSYRLPSVGPAPQVKERVGRTTLFSSSAMSSGRLFLDRVGRHQSPSPLHRRDQNKLIALSAETNYHRAGRQCLNWLSHLSGQAQTDLSEELKRVAEFLKISVKPNVAVPESFIAPDKNPHGTSVKRSPLGYRATHKKRSFALLASCWRYDLRTVESRGSQ
jgi:hypothetical protein